MLPIRDDQPRYSTPWVTRFLIALNLLIFLLEATLDRRSLTALIYQFGVVPAHWAALLAGANRYSVPVVGVPAWIILGYWFVLNFLSGTATALSVQRQSVGGVAFWAHVGGFVSGALLVKVFGERQTRHPYAVG